MSRIFCHATLWILTPSVHRGREWGVLEHEGDAVNGKFVQLLHEGG